MAVAPKLAGDTIYRGAAHIIIDKPATKDDWKYIFAQGEVVVKFNRPERENIVEGWGNVNSPSTDETITVTFTPASQVVDATILAFLYGSALSATPGSSWYGSSSTAVYVHTQAGKILTLTNCKPTTFVPITFGARKPRFGGSITLTGILGRGMARTEANALFTDWADETFTAEPDEADFASYPCAAAWAALAAPATELESMDGWTFAPKVQLNPVTTANLGTIDYYVGNGGGLEISGTPANISLSDLWHANTIGSSRQIGSTIAGGNFTITEDYPGLSALASNARLIEPASSFSIEKPVAGQCVWRARRAVGGAYGTLALTPEA